MLALLKSVAIVFVAFYAVAWFALLICCSVVFIQHAVKSGFTRWRKP